jgi:hypothetical protein
MGAMVAQDVGTDYDLYLRIRVHPENPGHPTHLRDKLPAVAKAFETLQAQQVVRSDPKGTLQL